MPEHMTSKAWPSVEGVACYWCGEECGGTCLKVTGSTQMTTGDPAYHLLTDGHTSTPKLRREGCYICEDPEYAQMGLPLCNPCPRCMKNAKNEGEMGHIPADDITCDDCGLDYQAFYQTCDQDLSKYEELEKTFPPK